MIKGIIIAIIIGYIVYSFFGWIGLLIVGGIVIVGGIFFILIGMGSSGSSSNSSSSSNITMKIMEYSDKYPNKCGSCINYSISLGGICKNENITKSPDNTCPNWRG
ncbi:MAG: hypothetical protein FWD40_06975 [Treponema sp.]|nr:hypothetical protein [Treponema sp.]